MSLSNFFHELSVLKILPRAGSFIAGIKNPDTVGEHVFRATQIAFVLAEMEGGNGEHSAFLVAIHDNGEARVGDHHKIMSRYISGKKDFEQRAFFDQLNGLPEKVSRKYQDAFQEFECAQTIESICAKDADLLECAFQAKEFLDQGYSGKQNWLNNIEGALKTETAKNIFQEMKSGSSMDWWKNLKVVEKR